VSHELEFFHYVMISGDFCMVIAVLGIDTYSHCGPFSSVDFVRFVWDNSTGLFIKSMP